MGKTAKKAIWCSALILVTVCAAIPLSMWIHLLLQGEYSDRNQLRAAACLASLTTDKQHGMLYLLLLLVIVMLAVAVWMLGHGGETFDSETVQHTNKIRTPVAAGQGQHGTSRWMTRKEAGALFCTLELDPSGARIAALLEQAGREQKLTLGKENASE